MASMNLPPTTPAPEDDGAAVRRRLLESAAQILDENGPQALTVRRLAKTANVSTMAVYTHFGGMPALVREIVAEGFRRLADRVSNYQQSQDPVADLVELAFAYRANAQQNPHLYSVMFGATSLGGYRLAPEEREIGSDTFAVLSKAVGRAMSTGALRAGNPARVANELWAAMHGYVMIELAGMHLTSANPVADVFRPLITNLLRGLAA